MRAKKAPESRFSVIFSGQFGGPMAITPLPQAPLAAMRWWLKRFRRGVGIVAGRWGFG